MPRSFIQVTPSRSTLKYSRYSPGRLGAVIVNENTAVSPGWIVLVDVIVPFEFSRPSMFEGRV